MRVVKGVTHELDVAAEPAARWWVSAPAVAAAQLVSNAIRRKQFFGQFELPLILTLMAMLGVIDSAFLKAKRRYAVVVLAVISAILTPPDLISMLMMLVLGIVYHVQFMIGLRKTRAEMAAEGLIHGESRFPASMTLITALALLAIGIAAIISMVS